MQAETLPRLCSSISQTLQRWINPTPRPIVPIALMRLAVVGAVLKPCISSPAASSRSVKMLKAQASLAQAGGYFYEPTSTHITRQSGVAPIGEHERVNFITAMAEKPTPKCRLMPSKMINW